MLFVLILLALVVALYFLAPKKEPSASEHFHEDVFPTNPPTTNSPTRATAPVSPFANTRFAGELIEPTDKRITKALAVKMHAQVIRQAFPGKPEKAYKSATKYFAENASSYWEHLEQDVPTWEIDDLKENIEGLKDDLWLESEDDQPDQERIEWLQGKIKLRSQELKELKARARKYKNRDLRFFLASELNNLIHGVEPEDTETLAQKTNDFWRNKPKSSTAEIEDDKDS